MTKTFQQTFFTILCISVVLTACSCTYAQTDDLKKQILNEFKDFKDYVKNNEYNHEGYIEKKQNDKLSIWEKAVEAGIAEGQFLYGIYCIDTEKYDEDGIKWIRKAAEQGNDEAQLLIANTYSSNAGHEKEAVKWYRKAAEQGNAMAQLILGGYYAEGIGVDKNLEEAVKWFRKSAEHNNPDGQWFLGCCYADGKGLTKDEEEAIKWWQKAAKQGHELASKKLEDYKKLADNPNDSNKNRIIKAVQKGDLKTVKKLVEIEPSILKTQNTDPIIDINKYPVFRGVLQNNVDGRNLLHFAASVPESFDVLKYLIEQKADVNAIDGRGLTPLFCAALVQNEKAVLYLLEHGADRPQFKHYQLPERELNLAKFYGIMDGGRKISERKVEHDDHTEVIETFDLSTMDRGYNSLRASRKQLIDKIAAYINSVSH